MCMKKSYGSRKCQKLVFSQLKQTQEKNEIFSKNWPLGRGESNRCRYKYIALSSSSSLLEIKK